MDFARHKSPKKKINKYPIKKIGITLVLVLFVFPLLLFFYFLMPQKGRVNIVLIGRNVNLLSFDNDKKTLTIITVPDKAYLPMAYGKGQITSESLHKFTSLSKQKSNLLTITMREFLGLPIDGWLVIPDSYNLSTTKDFLNLRKQQLSLFSFKPFFNAINTSNLSALYLKRFYFNLNSLRLDKITFLNLEKSGIFTKEILPDNSTVLITDNPTLDSIIANEFYEWKILDEAFSIAVINGTSINGLATRATRIITSMGGKVIMVGENQNKTVNCLINTPAKYLKSYTVWRLQQIFACEVAKSAENDRFDITINLGANYNKEINGL